MWIGDGGPGARTPLYCACDGTVKSTLAVALGILIANGTLLLLAWWFA